MHEINGHDDELANSKRVDDVFGLAFVDVVPSSTIVSIPCLKLNECLWLYHNSISTWYLVTY